MLGSRLAIPSRVGRLREGSDRLVEFSGDPGKEFIVKNPSSKLRQFWSKKV